MLRAVLDTNVIVSGTILGTGAPAEILDAWRGRQFDLIIGPAILSELERVLRLPKIARAYAIAPQDVDDLLMLLSSRAVVISKGRTESAPLRDPKDNPILAYALEGHADYVVTGDHDLLVLERFQEILIVSPAAFATLLRANE